jgi:HAMP domain-containing protein
MKLTLGVRANILLGFVAILLLLGLVAAIGTLQSLRTGAVVGESADRHAEAAVINRIDRDLRTMRQHVTNFAYSGNDATAASAREDMAAAEADVKSARAIISGARATKLDELTAALGDYSKLYQSLVDLKAQQLKLRRDHVDPDDAPYIALAEQLRAGTAKSDDDDAREAGNVLVEQGLLARYNSVSMLERRDSAFGAKADENFLKVETALGAITNAVIDANLVQQFKEFTNLEADYRKSVRELMALAERVNKTVASDLPALGDQVSKTIQALVASADQDAAALQETAGATASQTARLMVALGVGGVLAGVALALFLGGRVARPILSMTEAMRRLAAGELDLQIPSVGRGDEIGSMAKAVEVFRHNAAEMRRLHGEADKVHAANEARLKQLEAHYVEAARADRGRRSDGRRSREPGQRRSDASYDAAVRRRISRTPAQFRSGDDAIAGHDDGHPV